MGQYYTVIILAENENTKSEPEVIRLAICPLVYDCGAKIMEHSYITNPLVELVEYLLSKQGPYSKSRIVWAGDYASEELNVELGVGHKNLYHIADMREDWLQFVCPANFDNTAYRYIVNHTKKEYVDKTKCQADKHGYIIHPLPLLVSEGNGRSGGDYNGENEELCGIWARDVISMELILPDASRGYTELSCNFVR